MMTESGFFLSLITTIVVTVSSIAAWLIKKQISDISTALETLRTDFSSLRNSIFTMVHEHERRIATIEGILKTKEVK